MTRFLLAFTAVAGLTFGQEAAGITVDLNGATLLHRTPVTYPEAARTKNVKGSVTVEVTLDATGNVSDAHVLTGPEELRKAALLSVLGWHFAHEAAGMRRQVTIGFNPPPGGVQAPSQGRIYIGDGPVSPEELAKRRLVEEKIRLLQSQADQAKRLNQEAAAEETTALIGELRRQAEAARAPRNIQSIQVFGLSDGLRAELLSKLPVHEGDTLSSEAMERATRAVREFDEHMSITTATAGNGLVTIQISSPGVRPMAKIEATTSSAQRIKVGGNVQQSKLIRQLRPVYPAEAKQARIQGVVKLSAVIGTDGTVQQLEVISGHPLFVPSSLDAVKQWVYERTLLNGAPVEVVTQIDVNYTLSQ